MPDNDTPARLWQPFEEETRSLVSQMHDNARLANRRYSGAFYAFMIVSGIYWFLLSGDIKAVTIFSQELKNIDVLLWLIPVALAFLYYQGVCYFLYEIHYEKAIDAMLKTHFSDFYARNGQYLIYPPSFYNFERMTAKIWNKHGFVSVTFAGVVGLAFAVGPLLLVPGVVYANYTHVHGWQGLNAFAVSCIAVTFLLWCRALVMAVSHWTHDVDMFVSK